ncbi:helix-turn-helix transcriptional regulator [Runella sp. MFBS21]|uniref:helix-turn-helix domain-containing protein n=1 Tax=Runella sp. MFBS21 TaxID=3034018 RepID=UPI0023F6BF39|nr:AraC family transcriptional regulator [Runella sp. MFBS21]MDF7819812.1 helix-turn-helix transcriptional regulator [Runella sp. MFBS21]
MIDHSKSKYTTLNFKSISDFTNALGVAKPKHPLVSVFKNNNISPETIVKKLNAHFYMISFKTNLKGKMRYGQGFYDFEEGGMIFVAPNQVLSIAEDTDVCEGISLIFHSDFIRNYPLVKNISRYGFFSYNVNEALHLSESEKEKIIQIFESISQELNTSIDEISQDLVISYIEVLLNYCNRFYKRQFITRKSVNTDLLSAMEDYLEKYFGQLAINKGLPTVKEVAQYLNVSSSYLSDMLRATTGQNAQQHIHSKLIDKAKDYLSNQEMSVAEIAYQLGFEQPQSFHKLFKKKTDFTPLEYRQSLN